MKAKIIFVDLNKLDAITKEKLEEMLDEAYDQGYNRGYCDGVRAWYTPYYYNYKENWIPTWDINTSSSSSYPIKADSITTGTMNCEQKGK